MYFSIYDMYFMLPAIIVTLWAQFKVKSTFSKYSSVKTINGKSGFEAARNILDQNGLQNIPIELVNGKLTDHYDPKAGVIRLSNEVYNGRSVSAIGVAAHEAGHAVQYAEQYTPVYIRSSYISMTNNMLIYFVSSYNNRHSVIVTVACPRRRYTLCNGSSVSAYHSSR